MPCQQQEQLQQWRHRFVDQTSQLRTELSSEMDGLYQEFMSSRDTLLEGALAMDEEVDQLRAQCAAMRAAESDNEAAVAVSDSHTATREAQLMAGQQLALQNSLEEAYDMIDELQDKLSCSALATSPPKDPQNETAIQVVQGAHDVKQRLERHQYERSKLDAVLGPGEYEQFTDRALSHKEQGQMRIRLRKLQNSCWDELEQELEADHKHTEYVLTTVDAEERAQALESRIAAISYERNAIQQNAVELMGPDVAAARNFFEALNARTSP